jgi:hypothetical protein
MFLKHNSTSFLTGDDPFLPRVPVDADASVVSEELVFQPKHEGFIGIPHGGLAMGLCLDAWRRTGGPSYPVTARFRFGGSGVGIGAKTIFEVESGADERGPVVAARITKVGDKTPYVKAEISAADDSSVSVPVAKPPTDDFRELPYYRNCFVCGHHRSEPGLQRRFRVHAANGDTLTSAVWGYEPDDGDRARSFLIDREELHPAILVSIFDENTAWAGFMQTRTSGLSVRLELTLLRPVSARERLLFVGRPTGTRGNPKSPRFFLAEGTIFSMADSGNPQPVAFGRGEWVIMDQYTRQIRENLLPADDWQWIFGPAATEAY